MEVLQLSAMPSEENTNQVQEERQERECERTLTSTSSSFGLLCCADRIDYILMIFGAIGSCIHGAALPIFFVLFGQLIDSLGSLTSTPYRLVLEVSKHALQLVYLGFLVMVSAWLGVAFWMQTGERQAARMRVRYIQSVLRQDMQFFDVEARRQNLLYHISNDAIVIQDAIGDKMGHSIRYLAQFSVGFIVGFSSVWRLTLLTLAIVPLMVIAGGTYVVIMSSLSKRGDAAYAEAGKVAEEVLTQIRTVFSYVGEEKAIESYAILLKRALRLGKKSGVAKGLGVGSTYGLLFCSWALLLWYAGVLVRHQATNGGKAFATILNVIFSGFALGQAAPNLSTLAKGRTAAATMMKMIDKVPNSIKKDDNECVLHEVAGKIDFHHVSFTYPSRRNMILDDIKFSVSAGKIFAIVGSSGSGKSTIISLIERFYEPTSGQILLDGCDINKLPLKWLREQIGLVNQEPALFSASIAANILYGRENADMDDVVKATKLANAHSFIQALPEGYSTEVGEGATQLSGGQKQRIAIARALLRNPKILLLDESTSALDAESEHIVQIALEGVMSNRTTIVIAHRLSTIRNADTIAVLKNGKIVESGKHQELLSKGEVGEYAKLVVSQLLTNSPTCISNNLRDSKDVLEKSGSTRIFSSEEDLQKVASETTHHNIVKDSPPMTAPKPSSLEVIKLSMPEWPFLAMGSLGAILAGAEGPLFAFGISHILNAFYSHDSAHIKNEISKVSLLFVGAAIITVPVYLLQHYFYTVMGEKLTMRIRLSMFSAILRNEIGWFDMNQNNSGILVSALAVDATSLRAVLADRMSTIVQNVSLTVTAFTIAFVLSWRMASVVAATLPLLIGASIAEQHFLKGFGGDYSQAYARATSVAQEAINNIRTVAAFGLEEQVTSHFIQQLDHPNRKARLRGHISGVAYGLSQLFAFCSYALGLWYASQLLKNGESKFGDVMKSFMVLIISAIGIAETLSLTPDIMRGSEALVSVHTILERKTTIQPDDPRSEAVVEVKGDIDFRNVTFKYPTRPDVTIFKDLNLRVIAGHTLAVVGQSGSGKSSLISLIMRFYDPISGAILVDGKDIRGLKLRSLRQHIGLVQQEPVLFSTTIYENIAYGKDGASEIEVMKAAKAANAHGFISHMHEGYMTQVGDKGAQLSGGQKQRIAIARAILKDPSILLLDEATSALDTASERLVQEALNRLTGSRTTVVVAHRLSTIRDADVIAVLHNGEVHETGKHEDLIRRSQSLYAEFVHLQEQASSTPT